MACAVPRVDRGGYKLHLDCPVDAQFVQKLRSIQRQLESALDKGLPVKPQTEMVQSDSEDEEVKELQERTERLLSRLPMGNRIHKVLEATAAVPVPDSRAPVPLGSLGAQAAYVAQQRFGQTLAVGSAPISPLPRSPVFHKLMLRRQSRSPASSPSKSATSPSKSPALWPNERPVAQPQSPVYRQLQHQRQRRASPKPPLASPSPSASPASPCFVWPSEPNEPKPLPKSTLRPATVAVTQPKPITPIKPASPRKAKPPAPPPPPRQARDCVSFGAKDDWTWLQSVRAWDREAEAQGGWADGRRDAMLKFWVGLRQAGNNISCGKLCIDFSGNHQPAKDYTNLVRLEFLNQLACRGQQAKAEISPWALLAVVGLAHRAWAGIPEKRLACQGQQAKAEISPWALLAVVGLAHRAWAGIPEKRLACQGPQAKAEISPWALLAVVGLAHRAWAGIPEKRLACQGQQAKAEISPWALLAVVGIAHRAWAGSPQKRLACQGQQAKAEISPWALLAMVGLAHRAWAGILEKRQACQGQQAKAEIFFWAHLAVVGLAHRLWAGIPEKRLACQGPQAKAEISPWALLAVVGLAHRAWAGIPEKRLACQGQQAKAEISPWALLAVVGLAHRAWAGIPGQQEKAEISPSALLAVVGLAHRAWAGIPEKRLADWAQQAKAEISPWALLAVVGLAHRAWAGIPEKRLACQGQQAKAEISPYLPLGASGGGGARLSSLGWHPREEAASESRHLAPGTSGGAGVRPSSMGRQPTREETVRCGIPSGSELRQEFQQHLQASLLNERASGANEGASIPTLQPFAGGDVAAVALGGADGKSRGASERDVPRANPFFAPFEPLVQRHNADVEEAKIAGTELEELVGARPGFQSATAVVLSDVSAGPAAPAIAASRGSQESMDSPKSGRVRRRSGSQTPTLLSDTVRTMRSPNETQDWHSCDSSDSFATESVQRSATRQNTASDEERMVSKASMASKRSRRSTKSSTKSRSLSPVRAWMPNLPNGVLPDSPWDSVTSPGKAMQPRCSSCPLEGADGEISFHLGPTLPMHRGRSRAADGAPQAFSKETEVLQPEGRRPHLQPAGESRFSSQERHGAVSPTSNCVSFAGDEEKAKSEQGRASFDEESQLPSSSELMCATFGIQDMARHREVPCGDVAAVALGSDSKSRASGDVPRGPFFTPFEPLVRRGADAEEVKVASMETGNRRSLEGPVGARPGFQSATAVCLSDVRAGPAAPAAPAISASRGSQESMDSPKSGRVRRRSGSQTPTLLSDTVRAMRSPNETQDWHSCDSSDSFATESVQRSATRQNTASDEERMVSKASMASKRSRRSTKSSTKSRSLSPVRAWMPNLPNGVLPDSPWDSVTSPGKAMQPRCSSCPLEGADGEISFHLGPTLPIGRHRRGRPKFEPEGPSDLKQLIKEKDSAQQSPISAQLQSPMSPFSPLSSEPPSSMPSPSPSTSPKPSTPTSPEKVEPKPEPKPEPKKEPKPESKKGKGGPPKGTGKGEKGKDAKGKGKAKAEPRKPDIKPGVQVKRLFWNSFRVDSERKTVWNEIEREGAPIDTDQLEALFCDEPNKRMASPSPEAERGVKKIQVLDTQRRRQVCVMLARLPPGQAVAQALREHRALDSEQVELLLINVPSPEELKLLRKAQEEHTIDEFHIWDTAEEFLLLLVQVPHFELRLRAWHFRNTFEERFQALAQALRCVSEGCQRVLTSPSIRHLLGIVLYVGNYLNGGTPRGRADGFALDTLVLMRTVKMSQGDKPGTLVDYVTGQMERVYPGDLQSVFAPGGDFELLKAAARHKGPDLVDELRAFKNLADELQKKMGSSEDASMDECAQAMTQQVEVLAGLEAEQRELEARYEEIVVWFHMEDKGIRKPTDEFFGIWAKFLADIQTAKKAYEEQALREKRKNSMPPRRSSMAVPKEARSRRSLTPRRHTSGDGVADPPGDGGAADAARGHGTPGGGDGGA
ncbi:unnamed protein product [Effrenium voratum]|uniref:FH2 domain-containing protein n=1 Tax=Effrenium voratum TaxID=2562239 RepID=A0AA36JIS1_9DINO|nr:unnamed protein product [Effrenium voratum]